MNEGREDISLGSGTVTVTRFDKDEKIFSGCFNGEKIKHGQFDVQYH
jgi:hypothetical protein